MKTIIALIFCFSVLSGSSPRCQTMPADFTTISNNNYLSVFSTTNPASDRQPADYDDEYGDGYPHRTEINPVIGMSFSSMYSAPQITHLRHEWDGLSGAISEWDTDSSSSLGSNSWELIANCNRLRAST